MPIHASRRRREGMAYFALPMMSRTILSLASFAATFGSRPRSTTAITMSARMGDAATSPIQGSARLQGC